MGSPEGLGEDAEVLPTNPPLILARAYFDNARRIGEPGSPTMIEAAALQAAHADMARAASLLSIAESLHRIAADGHSSHRRLGAAATHIETVAKELTKLRYLARGGGH
jgi:hypothetical protein